MSDEKTSLMAAMRYLAEQERRTASEHATPGELAAYHEGTLPEPVAARVREHLVHCKLCSDLLLDLAGFADLAPPPGIPELTDAEVEEDWQVLRKKLDMEKGKIVLFPPPPEPVPFWHKPLPWKVAAAAALAATLGLSARVLQLTQEEQARSEPRVVTPLNPGGQERGPGESLQIPATEDRVLYLEPGPEDDYDKYQVDIIRNTDGLKEQDVVNRIGTFEAPPGSVVPLLIPKGSLEPGSYKALLYGIEGTSRQHSSTLAFEVNGS